MRWRGVSGFCAGWLRSRLPADAGQVSVLFAMMMVPIIGAGALTLDIANLWHERQVAQYAVDAGALGGAQSLPGDVAAAEATASALVLANAPSLTAADVSISFRCLVGDRNHDGVADASDIPSACDPKADASWIVSGGLAVSPCVPAHGAKCNVIVVTVGTDVPFVLAPVIGFNHGDTGNLVAAACRGLCGGPPTVPVDVVLVIDRTGSMSGADITNARTAANALLSVYDPTRQWVALGLLGPSRTTGATCSGVNSPARGLAASSTQYAAGSWVPVALSGTGAPLNEAYKNADGTLNTSSTLVKAIRCFDTSGTGTNLSTPITAASQYLQANGRVGVRKGIILETDGSPNYGGAGTASDYTCVAAANAASTAKAAGIEIVTIGFGLAAGDLCPDSSGVYRNVSVLQLLSDMSTSSVNNGCTDAENTDGDHFYCLPKTSQLQGIFESAAAAVAGGPRLLVLPH